jgi:hypothetical protein
VEGELEQATHTNPATVITMNSRGIIRPCSDSVFHNRDLDLKLSTNALPYVGVDLSEASAFTPNSAAYDDGSTRVIVPLSY